MSEKILFEVEQIAFLSGRGVLVLAKRTGDTDFTIKPGQKLNGCEISEGNIPRKLDDDGRVRLDVWGFILKNKNHQAYFSIGDIVELSQ